METKQAKILSLFVLTFCFTGVSGLLCINNYETFNCSSSNLTEMSLPTDISTSSIKRIDFSWNSIQSVTPFNYTVLASTLTYLNLNHNQISVISDNAFSLLKNLAQLDLSYNSISGEMLHEIVFEGLTALQELYIEGNPLQHLKTNTFSFMEMPALTYLDLSNCTISEMDKSSLDLPSLQHLDLSWNLLEGINRDSFQMLTHLNVLDMSHNNIKVLSEVPYLPEIVTMYFDNNGMEKLSIKEGIVLYADNIQKLYLRNNNIEKFTIDSLPLELATLSEIDMSNNPLVCNCEMKWIKMEKYDFEDRNISLPCRYPPILQGRNLLTVPSDELICPIPLMKIAFLLSIFIFAVIFVGMVGYICIRRRKRRRMGSHGDMGGDYTIVYTQNDDEEARIDMADGKALLKTDREFDV